MDATVSLWILLVVAVATGPVVAFGSRLKTTGLWVGRALVPPEAASAMPRGVEDAVTDGWPSTVGLATLLPFVLAALGFLHSFWLPFVLLLINVLASMLSKSIGLIPCTLDWYLLRLATHAERRRDKYLAATDALRSDAAARLATALFSVYEIYRGSGVQTPDVAEAMNAPCGDPRALLPSGQM